MKISQISILTWNMDNFYKKWNNNNNKNRFGQKEYKSFLENICAAELADMPTYSCSVKPVSKAH